MKLICPKCKKERQFDKDWWIMFGESYAERKQMMREVEKASWVNEKAEVMKELQILNQEIQKEMEKLPIKTQMRLRTLEQKAMLLRKIWDSNET